MAGHSTYLKKQQHEIFYKSVNFTRGRSFSGSCRYDFPAMNNPTIPKIKKAVAEGFQVTVKDIDSRTRRQPIATARQCVYYYARKLLRIKYMDLGKKFNRNHTNIVYAVKTIENLRQYDVETRSLMEGLESEFPWLKEEVEA